MANSVFVACTGVVIQLFFSSLAGFALAKYEFKGKQAITLLMLATLLIPGQVTLAPTYELIYRMGLVDTYAGLLVPGAVSVFGIFLFRQAAVWDADGGHAAEHPARDGAVFVPAARVRGGADGGRRERLTQASNAPARVSPLPMGSRVR